MKPLYQFFTVLLITLLFASVVSAQDSTKVKKRVTEDMIEESLLTGAKSSNEGLKISSAYYLGETKSSTAVIPLMAILRDDPNPQARVMAALSLFKIADERGIFLIKNIANKDDENETVKKMCQIFYNMHIQRKLAE